MSSSPVQRRTSRGSARAHLDSACDKRAHHDRASFCGCPGAPLERRGVNPRLAGVGGQTNGPEDLGRRLRGQFFTSTAFGSHFAKTVRDKPSQRSRVVLLRLPDTLSRRVQA